MFMSTIILCALADRARQRGQVSTITVKRVPAYPSLAALAPTKRLVYGYKHDQGDARFAGYPPVSQAQYITEYRALILARLPQIANWYQGLPTTNTHALTLCCYCPPGVFCHRQLVYKLLTWLNRKLCLKHQVSLH
jgi:hypothetical protein